MSWEFWDEALAKVTPMLALLATSLGLRGETWDKDRRRPTRVGYATLTLGLLTAIASIVASIASSRLRDNAAAMQQRDIGAITKEQQRAADQVERDNARAQRGLRETIDALRQTARTQEAALDIAQHQLPIDDLEVWFHRSELNDVLARHEVGLHDGFVFEKPVGDLFNLQREATRGSFAIYWMLRPLGPPGRFSALDSERYDAEALKRFAPVFGSLCHISVSPAVVQESDPELMVTGSERLRRAVLDAANLVLHFSPNQRLSAAYFNNRPARVEMTWAVYVFNNVDPGTDGTVKPVESPERRKGDACVTPGHVRLRIRTLGFAGDTGWLRLGHNRSVGQASVESKPIKLVRTAGENEPPTGR